jgi:hypothetical protein
MLCFYRWCIFLLVVHFFTGLLCGGHKKAGLAPGSALRAAVLLE